MKVQPICISLTSSAAFIYLCHSVLLKIVGFIYHSLSANYNLSINMFLITEHANMPPMYL